MLLTFKHKLAPKPFTYFMHEADRETGRLGRKIGYCSGCSEPIIVMSSQIHTIVDYFGTCELYDQMKKELDDYYNKALLEIEAFKKHQLLLLNKSLMTRSKERIIKLLGGNVS